MRRSWRPARGRRDRGRARWAKRPQGPRRVFAHTACGADLEPSGRCPACLAVPGPAELDSRPGPGRTAGPGNGVAGAALAGRRPLLVPVRG